MMAVEDDVQIPTEFKQLRAAFPVDFERQAGYRGPHRWIAFWWDDGEDAVVWNDGYDRQPSDEWELWTTFVSPINAWVRYNIRGATLGATEEPATHALVWDRMHQRCFLAPLEEAEAFLKQQAKAV